MAVELSSEDKQWIKDEVKLQIDNLKNWIKDEISIQLRKQK